MLYKGIVTKSKSEFLYVWSKSFGGEAILDKRLVPTCAICVGVWIAFSVKVGSNFIDDFTDIPDLLPTRVNEHGRVMVKARIAFRPNDVSGCNLLAHSNDLGTIGIFQSLTSLKENCDYDVWVERIPQTLSSLEDLYKTSWYINEELSEQIMKTSLERVSSVRRSLSSEFSSRMKLQDNALEESSNMTHTTGSVFGSVESNLDEAQEYSPLCTRSSSKQSFFTEPCAAVERIEEVKEAETVIGLITTSFNGKAFIWSSVLGRGMLLLRFDQKIQHGEWIKFIPCRIDNACRQKEDKLGRCKYIAKKWCVVNPLYPTRSYRTIVSVQVKLFVPRNYRHGLSDLWAEFFGTVSDSLQRINEFWPSNDILGRCFLVRVMEMKDDCDAGSNWVVHKVLQLLENEEAVPNLKSQSFAADALRYMNDNLFIHNAMKKVDWNLVKQLREPHLLPDEILECRTA
ncbi:unnamed protein product [Litomosoides sigmodontis]|uniref:Uncharacterized protein n=1 Tax=Litomosoides sigmodontis TaxID=42156 RepID=A0A3P6V8E8_LITSI|nr:unnamed protein product [Litomosoides sigmodontis]